MGEAISFEAAYVFGHRRAAAADDGNDDKRYEKDLESHDMRVSRSFCFFYSCLYVSGAQGGENRGR